VERESRDTLILPDSNKKMGKLKREDAIKVLQVVSQSNHTTKRQVERLFLGGR